MFMTQGEFTAVVQRMNQGDDRARNDALQLVYAELQGLARRRLAGQKPGSIEASDLVNEAYARLAGRDALDWQNRRHFFALAARAMHDVLVERARARGAKKRGGDWRQVTMHSAVVGAENDPIGFLLLDDALQRLCEEHAACGEVIMLTYFAGLTIAETADALDVSKRSVDRLLKFARAWLRKELSEQITASG
ncbi:MAG: ECF-type sigma factor [Pseudomonadota bacterium]